MDGGGNDEGNNGGNNSGGGASLIIYCSVPESSSQYCYPGDDICSKFTSSRQDDTRCKDWEKLDPESALIAKELSARSQSLERKDNADVGQFRRQGKCDSG